MSAAIMRLNPTTMPDAGQVGYSQISVADPGRLAFVSGQVAWSVDGGAVPGTITQQTEVVLGNLGHALDALGARPQDIVQMRIYVVDLTPERQELVMPLLGAFLGGARPSLTGIGVSRLASPDLEIEIEMIVLMPA